MKTVWLALFCLIGLATMVTLKIGMSPYASADVLRGDASSALADVSRETGPPADAPSSETGPIATNTQSDALTKGDGFDVFFSDEVKSLKSVVITPAETEPKPSNKTEQIVS